MNDSDRDFSELYLSLKQDIRNLILSPKCRSLGGPDKAGVLIDLADEYDPHELDMRTPDEMFFKVTPNDFRI